MRKYLLLALIPAMMVAGCQNQKPQGAVVARVNKAVLTENDIREYLPAGAANIPPAQKEEFLRRWIDSELFYQEAVKRGMDKDPKIAKQLRDVRRDILANQLLQKEIVEKQAVTETDAKLYFDSHQPEFQHNVRYSQIVVLEAQQAEAVKAALDGGADFAKLAKETSLDANTKGNGGDIGIYLQRGSGEMPLDFEEKVFALAKGQVSEPIKLFNGFFIVKLADKRPVWPPVKFEDVREGLTSGLMMIKQKQAFDSLVESLKKTAQVESHPEMIK
jgi:parvulin-like peptidyl-prolyl isomerase